MIKRDKFDKEAALSGSQPDAEKWFNEELKEWQDEEKNSEAADLELMDALGLVFLFKTPEMNVFASAKLKEAKVTSTTITRSLVSYKEWHDKQESKGRKGSIITKQDFLKLISTLKM